MKQLILVGLVALLIGLAIGNYFAPEKIVDNQAKIDSLRKDLGQAQRDRDMWKDSSRQKDILAETWFNKAVELEKTKKIIRIVYATDTAKNHSYSSVQRDSLLRSIYLH